MERFIADLVQSLDSGKIDRREFCKSLALAAAVYGAAMRAGPGPTRLQDHRHQPHVLYVPGLPQGARMVRMDVVVT